MKRISILLVLSLLLVPVFMSAGSKSKGEKCFSNSQCKFGLECESGVCIEKNKLKGSRKAGNPCNIDADCIGSGTCEKNSFGKKVCTG